MVDGAGVGEEKRHCQIKLTFAGKHALILAPLTGSATHSNGCAGASLAGPTETKGIFVDSPSGTFDGLSDPGGLGRSGVGRSFPRVSVMQSRAFALDILGLLSERYNYARPRARSVDPAAIDRFCDQLIATDGSLNAELLEEARSGVGELERIYEDVVAPSARELGTRWEDDRSSFVDVTVGVARLQAMVRDVGQGLLPVVSSRDAPKALLASCPGDDHTLGITLVADYFRRAGWHVSLVPEPDLAGLVRATGDMQPNYIGLSIGTLRLISRLRETVKRLRDVAPDAVIAVGGSATQSVTNLREQVDADEVVVDATKAALGARRWTAGRVYADA